MLKGTPEDRIDILERGMLEGMQQPDFQSYLQGSGLDSSSIADREAWDNQVRRLYSDARDAMISLGIIQDE